MRRIAYATNVLLLTFLAIEFRFSYLDTINNVQWRKYSVFVIGFVLLINFAALAFSTHSNRSSKGKMHDMMGHNKKLVKDKAKLESVLGRVKEELEY